MKTRSADRRQENDLRSKAARWSSGTSLEVCPVAPSPALRFARGRGRTEMVRLRKRHRVLFLAAVIAAVVVPVGFALSLPASQRGLEPRAPGASAAASSVVLAVPAVLPTESPESGRFLAELPDAVKLFAIGTLLVGLATLMRKAG
jgi:hypothetical protein